MKTENFIIISDQVKENLIEIIRSSETDGKTKVTIGPAGTKSARQRGLQYIWYKEISKAGIGGKHEDTVEGVALVVKWRWVVPILIRDDEFFADLFALYKNKWKNDPDRMRYFIDTQVHTEDLNTSQMAEVLTEVQNHYSQDVNLTDPQEGLTNERT